MMIASNMASTIQGLMAPLNLVPATPPSAYSVAFLTGVTTYITANCLATYGWVGINPSGLPDPFVVFTAVPTFPLLATAIPTLTPITLLPTLQAVLQGALFFPLDPTLILSPLTPGVVAPILPPISPVPISDPFLALQAQCQSIIVSFSLAINPVPALGAHIAFTAPPGTGASMISIL